MNAKIHNLIEFDELLLTGVEEMDKEHKNLVEMLNHVYVLLKEGKKEEVFEYFYKEILFYVDPILKMKKNLWKK